MCYSTGASRASESDAKASGTAPEYKLSCNQGPAVEPQRFRSPGKTPPKKKNEHVTPHTPDPLLSPARASRSAQQFEVPFPTSSMAQKIFSSFLTSRFPVDGQEPNRPGIPRSVRILSVRDQHADAVLMRISDAEPFASSKGFAEEMGIPKP